MSSTLIRLPHERSFSTCECYFVNNKPKLTQLIFCVFLGLIFNYFILSNSKLVSSHLFVHFYVSLKFFDGFKQVFTPLYYQHCLSSF